MLGRKKKLYPTASENCEAASRQLKVGNPAAAVQFTDRAIKLDPSNVFAHHLRGIALSDLNFHEDAVATFRAVLSFDPTATYEHHRIGVELLLMKSYVEALPEAEKAVAVAPEDHSGYLLRAAVLLGLERRDEALASLDRACELETDTYGPRWDRAIVLRSMGRLDEAIADYDWIAAHAPKPAFALVEKGVTLAIAGRLDDALATLPASPDHPISLVWAAAIQWHQGHAAAAHDLFAQAGNAYDNPTRPSTSGDYVALRAITACALGQADQQAAAVADLDPPGADKSVTLPAIYALLSDPQLPGIEQLAQNLRDA